VLYLNGSKVATSGSALVFDGTNLGVGVTPSAWSSATGLQVQNAGIEGRSTANSYATFSANGYTDAGTWKYISSDFASRYTQFQGQHLWFTAASGTAGNTITFGDAKMTLNASGDLLVGTTSVTTGVSGTETTLCVKGNSSGKAAAFVAVNAAGTGTSFFGTGDSTVACYAGTATNHPLVFLTNNTERARITSDGQFCVASTAIRSQLGTNTYAIVKDAGIGAISQNGAGALDTGISINQLDAGCTMLLLASRNTSAGQNTESAVYIVRFYYDGNNAPTTTYVGGSSDFVTFGTSGSNTLTLANSGGGNSSYSWFTSR
jgi:hypothetical protein